MNNSLKENIVSFLKEKNYSYRKLEQNAGLHRNFLSQLLADDDKSPRIDSIIKLADALDMSLDDLVGRKGNWNSKKLEGFVAENLELFEQTLAFHAEHATLLTGKIVTDELFKSIREIYKFSIENNNGKLDKKFAKWYIENNFKS